LHFTAIPRIILLIVQTVPHVIEQQLRRFGAAIATARAARGWSQAELARRAGLSRRTLVNLESGAPGVAWGTVLHLAWLLELPLPAPPAERGSRRARRRAPTPDLNF